MLRIDFNQVSSIDRRIVGKHWTPKYLTSMQCILQATHGVVSPKGEFFEAAFGRNVKEFTKLLIMPSQYIIFREQHKNNGTAQWNHLLSSLTPSQKCDFMKIVKQNRFEIDVSSRYPKVNTLLSHYKKSRPKSTQGNLFDFGPSSH